MLSYEELLNKYNALIKENEDLKNQVNELKLKLGIPTDTEEKIIDETTGTRINKYSSTSEKISLYRSLFCGREDVFARRWYSKTTEKSGYQPVCENEWVDGLCDKRKCKCSACPNRKLSPITNDDIYKHLEGRDFYGRDVIGIYPMLLDETCHFLCADFDDKVDYFNIIDKTNSGKNIPIEFNGKLREEQEMAVNELLRYNIGVLAF